MTAHEEARMTMPDRWKVRCDADDVLRCPRCGDICTHVDTVMIAARAEDADFDHISVEATSGQVQTRSQLPTPTGPAVGVGRRHRIALLGSCEICGAQWAVVFTQHKGSTYVEVVPEWWQV